MSLVLKYGPVIRGGEAQQAAQGPLLPLAGCIIDTPCGAEVVRGWKKAVVNGRGLEATRLRLEAYLTYMSCPHLIQLPQTRNTNTQTSISSFQGRKP